MFPPKYFDNVSPEGGCSEGLDAFRFFLTGPHALGPKNIYSKRKSICWYTLARGKVNSLGEDDVWNRVILIA